MTKNFARRDRAHGQGLPASIDIERLAHRLVGNQVRVASASDAMARGFEPTAEASMFRKAHSVWALRPNEDGEGYVLVREQEERAVDMRRSASAHTPRVPTRLKVGTKVAFVHRGQLADAMIVFINPSEDMADLLTLDGEEHVQDVPLDQLESSDDDDDPFEVAEIRVAMSGFVAPGDRAIVETPFAPVLHGGALTLKPGTSLISQGWHEPGPDDAVIPAPRADTGQRVRFVDDAGQPVFLTRREVHDNTDTSASLYEGLQDTVHGTELANTPLPPGPVTPAPFNTDEESTRVDRPVPVSAHAKDS